MKIKYDKRTVKILLIVFCFALILFLTGLLVMHFEIAGLEILFLMGIYAGGVLLLYSFLNLIYASCYFARLKKHGFEVPYDRKKYENNLKNLPCLTVSNCSGDAVSQSNKESIILAITNAVIFIFTNVWNIHYIIKWYKYLTDTAITLMCIQIIIDLCWLIMAIVYFRQRSNEKYRDDVELDLSRKERVCIERGFATVLVFLVMVIFIKTMTVNASDYMFRSRQLKDQSTIEHIKKCVLATYSQMNESDDSMLKNCDSYVRLMEGCYISEWSEPEDAFQTNIAKMMGISDYSELGAMILTSDGEARIYVKISDGDVYVCLKNPLPVDYDCQFLYETRKK